MIARETEIERVEQTLNLIYLYLVMFVLMTELEMTAMRDPETLWSENLSLICERLFIVWALL